MWIEAAAIRFWFIPILFFIGFFFLFWNGKRWKWSVVKTTSIAAGCALGSGVAVALLLWLIAVVFN